jgi:hypothetical protein
MKRAFLVIACVAALSVVLFAQDADYQKWMKDVSSTNTALGKELTAKSPDAANDAKKLADIFGQVHDYWQKKGVDDAAKESADAQAGFKQAADLVTAGKFDEASAAVKTASNSCASCHMDHRDRHPDGSYGIK